MDRLLLRAVVFGVAHTSAGAHALDFTRRDDADIAQVVAMLELSLDDVGDNLHLPVPVLGETAGGPDDVVVEHPQRTERHVGRVMVVVEREMPVGGKPLIFKMIAVGAANYLHPGCLWRLGRRVDRSLYGIRCRSVEMVSRPPVAGPRSAKPARFDVENWLLPEPGAVGPIPFPQGAQLVYIDAWPTPTPGGSQR